MDPQHTILKDRYHLIRLLGRGGMGEVFLADDKLLSRQVAVKKVLYSDNEYLLKTAEKEAMVLARLRHQSLPKILDYFNLDYAQYIVMEYVDGRNLGEMLQTNQAPFTTAQVWPWVETLLDILEYLHKLTPPVVHRDIKPQNIKITDEGKLFLLDFGLVKDTPTRVSGGSLSQSVYGYSQSYAPLEQINGDPTSVQTDVYGLCATIYHLLTNVKPADALDRATKRIERKPDPLRPAFEVNPNIPQGFSLVLEEGLHLNGDERIKSVQALRQLLQQERNKRARIEINIGNEGGGYTTQIATPPPPSPSPRFSGNKRLAAVIAGAVVVVLVLSVLGYNLYRSYQERLVAQGLFAEAQALERNEGALSPNACAKYNEVEVNHLEQSARNELVRKTNSCTTGNLIFQDALEKEKATGLTHETAASYRKIAENYPGSVFSRQAEKKVGEYERNEQATLRAYKALQKADYIVSLDIQQITPDLFKKLSDTCSHSIHLYGEIDLSNVDPLLSGHIINSMESLKKGRALFAEIEGDRLNLATAVEAYIKRDGEQYRSYYENQGNVEFGKLLVTKYADRYKAFEEETRKLDDLDKTYGSQLEAKFNNRGFIDQN